MIYDIDYCDKYLDELLDKLGGDYFPLPIKFGRFITHALDFIRDNSGDDFEQSQEKSDNIKTLVVRTKNPIAPVAGEAGLYQMAEPTNYMRLISIYPYAIVNSVETKLARKVHIVKEGQRLAYERDPFRKPTPFEPNVYRIANFFEISTNDALNDYEFAQLAYIKKPTFGNIGTGTDRIINLPDMSIEIILQKTAESLRFTYGDEDSKDIYNFEQTFGKSNR
jgi:hypothetical protein